MKDYIAENNPNWKGGKTIKYIKCPQCGDGLGDPHSKICRKCYEENRKINNKCSDCGNALKRNVPKLCRVCFDKKRAENKIHPNHYKSKKWYEIREETIIRDGEKCVECGISREQHFIKRNIDLSAHHVIKFRECREHKRENLITLCQDCHRESENDKNKNQKFIKIIKINENKFCKKM